MMAVQMWSQLSIQDARAKQVLSAKELSQGDSIKGSLDSAIHEPRNLVLAVNGRVGALCDCFRWRTSRECSLRLSAFTSKEKGRVAEELGSAVALLLVLADHCNIDLPMATQLKLELNAQKYPVDLVRGSALKYDAYKMHTGFAKGSKQVTTEGVEGDGHLSGEADRPWSSYTFEQLRSQLVHFAHDRGWEKFHTPRDICLALSGEVGELCEIFQFKEEEHCAKELKNWTKDARDKLAQELSDVCIYLCRLSDVCGLDLTKILLEDDELLRRCFSLGTIEGCVAGSSAGKRCPNGSSTEALEAGRQRSYMAACVLLGVAAIVSWSHRLHASA